LFLNPNRQQLRQMYIDAWRKHRNQQPLQPLEAQIADVIELHPEYQALFNAAEDILDKDWLPEGGASNPFLHMGLHLAVRDQVATDRPAGISHAYQSLLHKRGSRHEAEHQMIECLADALWNAQRSGQPPDEAAYLAKIRRVR
jgi:Domain of unknown function (DUF1841)